jgi:small subunit ribosomal protein S18
MIKRKKKEIKVPRNRDFKFKKDCMLCKKTMEIDYKNVDLIFRFISSKKKIVSRRSSGNCAKHQRKIAREIKRARFLSLVPHLAK